MTSKSSNLTEPVTVSPFTFGNSVYMLIGLNPVGVYSYGAYFWLMHTAFIPTLLYLIIIFMVLIIKLLMYPIHWIFGKNYHNDKPYSVTGEIMGFVGLVLLCIVKYTK